MKLPIIAAIVCALALSACGSSKGKYYNVKNLTAEMNHIYNTPAALKAGDGTHVQIRCSATHNPLIDTCRFSAERRHLLP